MTLPGALLRSLAGVVGEPHVLTGDAAAGFAVDWTGRFAGHTPAVVRPRDTAEVAAVLALCTDAGVPVVPQGGNTGLVGGGVPLHGEVVVSLITAARLRLVPRLRDTVTALAGVSGLDQLHALARRAVREVPGLVSAEFFTRTGLDILVAHAGLAPPLPTPAEAYLLLEASGPGAFGDLADVIGDREAAVGESAADRARLWSYRERHPEAAGFLGVPIKLDVSVPAAQWVRLASGAAGVVTDVDPGAAVITFGHVADENVHVNIVPAAAADGRHEDAVFTFVASLGGSISAEHGIGALKAPWLPLARTDAERALFARIRSALDPSATLNPNVLPRLSPRGRYSRMSIACASRSRST